LSGQRVEAKLTGTTLALQVTGSLQWSGNPASKTKELLCTSVKGIYWVRTTGIESGFEKGLCK